MRERLRAALPALIGLGLFLVALAVLRRELNAVSWRAIAADVRATSPSALGLAVVLTAANYAVLTLYDFMAFASIGRTLSRWRIALTSLLAYAVANNVGFAMLSGASVRYRFYSRWGVRPDELSRIVISISITFWLGLLALGGLSLAVDPLPGAREIAGTWFTGSAGWILVGISLAYVATPLVRRAPLRIGSFEMPVPAPKLALMQLVVSSVDWILAAAVLYVLLPPSGATFLTVLGAFFAAQLLGLASHVPGGVGVFETLIILLLQPFIASGDLLPALVVYRAVYYLLPLSVALVALVADEVYERRLQTKRATAFLGQLSEQLSPRLLAAFTFLGGLVLLFSGATPAAEGRLTELGRMVPLGVIETSHFIGSLVGAALLLLSQGLARRLDVAYFLTVSAVVVGIAVSLLRAAGFEEAALLTLLLLVLMRARPAFDRKAALLETRFSGAWTAAVVAAIASSLWLGFFAFKHVEYSPDLWWQFALHGEASRFLRGSVGAASVVLLFALAQLIRPAPHEADEPSDADLESATQAIAHQTASTASLVYLRDKALLFNEDRSGFLMYAVKGPTFVAMGDPVGPPAATPDLIRAFLERCDDFGGTPVFYEVRKQNLHHYADFGLTFMKLGESARVDLQRFTFEGPSASKFRQVIRRLEKDGATFRVIPPADVPAAIEQLRTVSDDWLEQKAGGEKGFSLGFFDPEYLARFPIGLVERDNRVVAFANLWPGPCKEEISIDLMRYHRDAPKNVMEALFVHLIKWSKEQNYHWLDLGMAPMSGFEQSPVAPLWMRLGVFLYEHGEPLYNFQGLRAYKDKFDPVWDPRYLAYPGGLKLARILADVSALVAGGYRRILFRP
jgi:phosphatidylglycerol lysyltransferase